MQESSPLSESFDKLQSPRRLRDKIGQRIEHVVQSAKKELSKSLRPKTQPQGPQNHADSGEQGLYAEGTLSTSPSNSIPQLQTRVASPESTLFGESAVSQGSGFAAAINGGGPGHTNIHQNSHSGKVDIHLHHSTLNYATQLLLDRGSSQPLLSSSPRDTQTVSYLSLPAGAQDGSPRPTTPLTCPTCSSAVFNALTAPQNGAEIYKSALISHNLGYPLWIPSPNMQLPVAYRALGVQIGDVGTVTSEGGFSFLFNACHEATHPINESRPIPPGFRPFSLPKEDWAIDRLKEFDAGRSVFSSSVARSDTPNEPLKPVFTTSAPQAAVLMMPEPVYTAKLRQKGRLTTYVNENLRSWYQYFKTELGFDIENGDLRVVYGYRKSSAFGMAAINNGSTDPTTELKFSIDDSWAGTTGCKYQWHNRGCAEAKAGPSLDEKRDFTAINADAVDDPVNQCFFISTIDTKLSDKEWQQFYGGGPIPAVNQKADIHAVSPSFASPSASASESGHESGGDTPMAPNSGGRARSVSPQIKPAQAKCSDTSHCRPCLARKARPFHPSDILTDYLLLTNPDATLVTVCTDDWGTWMTDNIKHTSTLIDLVLSENEVCNVDGTVYLTPRERRTEPPLSMRVCTSTESNGGIFVRLELYKGVTLSPWIFLDGESVQRAIDFAEVLQARKFTINSDERSRKRILVSVSQRKLGAPYHRSSLSVVPRRTDDLGTPKTADIIEDIPAGASEAQISTVDNAVQSEHMHGVSLEQIQIAGNKTTAGSVQSSRYQPTPSHCCRRVSSGHSIFTRSISNSTAPDGDPTAWNHGLIDEEAEDRCNRSRTDPLHPTRLVIEIDYDSNVPKAENEQICLSRGLQLATELVGPFQEPGQGLHSRESNYPLQQRSTGPTQRVLQERNDTILDPSLSNQPSPQSVHRQGDHDGKLRPGFLQDIVNDLETPELLPSKTVSFEPPAAPSHWPVVDDTEDGIYNCQRASLLTISRSNSKREYCCSDYPTSGLDTIVMSIPSYSQHSGQRAECIIEPHDEDGRNFLGNSPHTSCLEPNKLTRSTSTPIATSESVCHASISAQQHTQQVLRKRHVSNSSPLPLNPQPRHQLGDYKRGLSSGFLRGIVNDWDAPEQVPSETGSFDSWPVVNDRDEEEVVSSREPAASLVMTAYVAHGSNEEEHAYSDHPLSEIAEIATDLVLPLPRDSVGQPLAQPTHHHVPPTLHTLPSTYPQTQTHTEGDRPDASVSAKYESPPSPPRIQALRVFRVHYPTADDKQLRKETPDSSRAQSRLVGLDTQSGLHEQHTSARPIADSEIDNMPSLGLLDEVLQFIAVECERARTIATHIGARLKLDSEEHEDFHNVVVSDVAHKQMRVLEPSAGLNANSELVTGNGKQQAMDVEIEAGLQQKLKPAEHERRPKKKRPAKLDSRSAAATPCNTDFVGTPLRKTRAGRKRRRVNSSSRPSSISSQAHRKDKKLPVDQASLKSTEQPRLQLIILPFEDMFVLLVLCAVLGTLQSASILPASDIPGSMVHANVLTAMLWGSSTAPDDGPSSCRTLTSCEQGTIGAHKNLSVTLGNYSGGVPTTKGLTKK